MAFGPRLTFSLHFDVSIPLLSSIIDQSLLHDDIRDGYGGMVEAWGPVYPPLRYPSYQSGLIQSPNSFIILVPISMDVSYSVSSNSLELNCGLETSFSDLVHFIGFHNVNFDACLLMSHEATVLAHICQPLTDRCYGSYNNMIFKLTKTHEQMLHFKVLFSPGGC